MQNNINITYDEIFTYDHLYNSYLKCIKGVKWKQSVQNYQNHNITNLQKVCEVLRNDSYKSKAYHLFILSYRGKVRECQSIHIFDRVIQKCLCDYCLLPLITPKLIHTNAACLKGKGTEFARNNFKKSMRKVGRNGYVLLIDFKSYFANIRHDILLQKLYRIGIDERTLNLIQYLLSLYDKDNKGVGLALGSQMSQSFALLYASEIDNYCYHYLNNKNYGRYMDDIYMFSTSKRKLERALANIRKIATKSCITLNHKKTKIVKVSNGVKYMKRRYIIDDNGHIAEIPNKDTFYRITRKMGKGLVTDKDFTSWYNGLVKFDCHNRLNKLKYHFYGGNK